MQGHVGDREQMMHTHHLWLLVLFRTSIILADIMCYDYNKTFDRLHSEETLVHGPVFAFQIEMKQLMSSSKPLVFLQLVILIDL